MLSEDRKIKTRAQLREYLAADCARYPLSARRIVPYLLQISEGIQVDLLKEVFSGENSENKDRNTNCGTATKHFFLRSF